MISLHSYRHGRHNTRAWLLVAGLLLAAAAWPAFAQDIFSTRIDRENEAIVVRGASLDAVSVFTLGGIDVATAGVTPDQLEIPFSTDVASAVQWPGSYRLEADTGAWISVYAAAPIDAPSAPPPPPPPPPPGGPDCPCIAGWEASGIPKDNFTLCFYDYSSQQQWIAGQRDNWFISAAYDPFNLIFDPADPGNSISYCALNDGTDYTVAEPVVNQDQFDDCDYWLWIHICL
jgi:hypothetical protein